MVRWYRAAMIEVRGLTRRFRTKTALDNVSFSVAAGEVTGFLGPNGAGKTTAMRLVVGLDRPTAGSALIGGRRLQDYPDPICQVGALLSSRFAHPRRSAFDHLLTIAATHGIPRVRVHEVIEETGLESVAGDRVGGFSLGMTQRLGIASALLGSPGVLILDEPINGLDLDGVRWFRELCRRYAESGAAVFLSSHLMSEVEQVADRVIVLGRGRVIADSSLAELRRGSLEIEVKSAQAQVLIAALDRRGVSTVQKDRNSFSALGITAAQVGVIALQLGVALEQLNDRQRSLEASYRALTEEEVEFRSTPMAPTAVA